MSGNCSRPHRGPARLPARAPRWRRPRRASPAPWLWLVLAGCAGTAGQDCVRVVSWADYRELALEQEVVDSFAVRYPEIPVCVESLTGSGIYREKVLTSIAAGTPPGVFLLDGIDIPAFVNRGVLLDLAPFAARAGLDTSAFHPRLLELFRRDGGLFAFPKGFTPMVMYYNRAMFESAGLPPPRAGWTWQEFRALADSLTRDTDGDGRADVWGFGWPREFFYLQSWIWTGGGDLLAPDASRATGYLDSGATIAAVRFYLDLAVRDSVTPRVDMFRSSTGVPMMRLFVSNRVGMFQSGHWSMQQLLEHERAGRIAFGVAPLPTREGVAPVSVLYASGWAVPRAAPHRRWAVQLAAFLASETAQRVRARAGLELPARPDVAQEIAARDPTGREAVFLEAAEDARHTWGAFVEPWREVQDGLLDLLDRPLVRGEPLDSVARELARRIDRLLEASR